MSLPLLQNFGLMQTGWKKLLDPLLANPIMQGLAIKSITLVSGVALVIPTKLDRTQQGWFITDINSNATVWRTQPFNAVNLTLQASANTVIDIWVF